MTPNELPKEFEWRPAEEVDGIGGRLFAFNTTWANGRYGEEHVGSLWANSDGTWRVTIWRLYAADQGDFEEVAESIPTFEEAFNYLWTLVQLGEVHFTFIEEENERAK
jgi:hypothetical protein